MALLDRLISPSDVQLGVAPTHIRRCNYRRMTAVAGKRDLPIYDVACLFPNYQAPIPLGDLETAKSACDSCTAEGIFRPDSD
jgi:hypothetical protein